MTMAMRIVSRVHARPLAALPACRISLRAFSGRSAHLVSTEEANGLVGKPDVRFLDIRNPMQYTRGHIQGAANMLEFFSYLALSTPQGVDHMQRTFEKLLRAKGITGQEQLICYEDSLRGMYGASTRAWYLLRTLGHPSVRVLDGGWTKWEREGRPVVKGDEEERLEGTFSASFNASEWADIETVKAIIDGSGGGAKLLDVRDQVEWDGESSSPYGVDFAPRKGRLPGAAWIEWYDFMEECKGEGDGEDLSGAADSDDEGEKFEVARFKHPDAIRGIMADKGFDTSDNVVLYCFKGARASNTLAALKTAGFDRVTVYFGSWNEWSREEDLPIAKP
mmetsp:Transcript_67166/g.216673  ORF Transcript_67166/g.216673 Transcript_67166/m.216673 type:complete len:335 (+) Transcript_67166:110-1114(+)